MTRTGLIAFCLAFASLAAQGRVVINEISYRPPDGMEEAEFIELHNTGGSEVDLTGWRFTKGIQYRFEEAAKIPANGFFVLAHNKELFRKAYGFEPGAVFKEALKDKGEKIELNDSAGKTIDSAKYSDSAPWPLSSDGEGPTLERISPEGESNDPGNWAPGPYGADAAQPGGTPGKQNSSYSRSMPPSIGNVVFSPRNPRPGQPVSVSASIARGDIESVRLLYRVAGPGSEKPEQSIEMIARENKKDFSATVPGLPENAIVRFRIEGVNRAGARRVDPAPFELQPAYSYFVHDKFEVGRIPWGFLVFVDEADYKREEERPKQGPGGMPQGNPEVFMARMSFEMNTDLAPVWADLCLTQQLSHAQIAQIRDGLA